MGFAQLVHTVYEACMIAATSGSAVLLVWQRRKVFTAVREFVAGIVALVHIRAKLETIVKELTTNGGSSIKDRVNALEGDVQTLKRESTKQIEILEGQNGVLQEMKKQNQDDLQEVRAGLKDLGDRFSRFVKHEADNDLHYSRLAEEERRRSKESEKK